MGIADRVLNIVGLTTTKKFNARLNEALKVELETVQKWQGETADAQRWDVPDISIYANQADTYRLSPILGTALDVLGDDVGLSKPNVKRIVGEEKRDIPNHEYEILLSAPNPLDSGLEFMRDTTIGYKLNGNFIWWLNRTSKFEKPTEIWPIPYQMISPVPDGNFYLKDYEYYPGNGKPPISFPTWQIVHFKTYNPSSRFWGLSPIESLATTLMGNLGMRTTKARQYTEYGGAPQSILAFKDWVNDEAWIDIKTEKRNAAARNEMMMLRGTGDGVSWMSRAISSRDAEFIDNLRADMEDVFNRMAPGLLAMLDKNATEANALAARATYSEKSLWKTLVTFAQKQTSDILPVYGRKLVLEYDDPRMIDRKQELDEQTAFERSHTIEEVRSEFYQDKPIGDERDKMLVGEIRVKASYNQNQPPQPDESQAPVEVQAQDTGGEDVSVKAAISDLLTWKRIAMKGKSEKAQAFKSNYIPSVVMHSIKQRLTVVDDTQAVDAIFKDAIERMKPKPPFDAEQTLRAIEAGLKVLESK